MAIVMDSFFIWFQFKRLNLGTWVFHRKNFPYQGYKSYARIRRGKYCSAHGSYSAMLLEL
jgi:hypothetical protein